MCGGCVAYSGRCTSGKVVRCDWIELQVGHLHKVAMNGRILLTAAEEQPVGVS